MKKLAYLSSTALCALALTAAVTPAAADTDLYGDVNFGFDWLNYEPDGSSDFHNNTFIAQGAFGIPLDGPWAVEGNFSFESQQFDDFGIPINFSIDTWQVGGVLVYEFGSDGRVGLDVAYQTVDLGVSVDGYRVGARGELFLQPNLNLRAAAGYNDYEGNFLESDGFYGSAGFSYYFSRYFGLRGQVDYYTYDFSLPPLSFDYDVWDFGAKLQYKFDNLPVIFGGHVNYGMIDVGAGGGSDTDVWVVGVDITALFGTDASDASLRDAEANSTFEPQRIGVKYFTF